MATTTEEILVSDSDNSRKPSERLTVAIKECASGFKRLRDNINDAIEIGKIEGYTTKEVGDMIRQELANNQFSDRSIRRYLPAEAKMQSKVRGTNLRIVLTANIKPADYQSQDLPKYTKQFLIEVIRYLEEKYVIKHQKQAIKQVVKQVKAAEPKQSKPRPIGKSPFSRRKFLPSFRLLLYPIVPNA